MSAPASTERRFVRLARAGGTARLLLDRPPLNVLDLAMLRELADALDEVRADRSVKALAVAGAGKAFCAGVDVADHTADRADEMIATFGGVLHRLFSLEIPVVAEVHGVALGGGCELALACDLVVARADARFGQPEVRLGVFPPAAAALLPALVGRRRAMEIVLTGRPFGAEDAQRWGLVNRVWPVDQFAAEADALLRALAAPSGPVVRLAKRAVAGSEGLDSADALERADALYRDDLMRLRDPHEGIAAFLEKREPVWQEA